MEIHFHLLYIWRETYKIDYHIFLFIWVGNPYIKCGVYCYIYTEMVIMTVNANETYYKNINGFTIV